jgi:formylmethanofuran dehydrogenase subunit E
MSNRRLVQHRQQRDTNTRDLADFKREVRTLKRQLSRANREVERLQGLEEEVEEKPVKTNRATCPKCGSTNLGQLTTPNGKRVTACKACRKWRSRAT